jgi:hypothetical protein
MNNKTGKKDNKKWRRFIIWIIIILLLYILSIGPVSALCKKVRFAPNNYFIKFFHCFYAPLIWLAHNTFLEKPLHKYMSFCYSLFNWI